MTTDNFISKVNALNGIYASKQREDHRMLIYIYKTCTHMCFAEILVKERVLNFFCRPQSTEVAEDVLQELFGLICDYQEEK